MSIQTIITPSEVKLVVNPETYVPLFTPDLILSHATRAGSLRFDQLTGFINEIYANVLPKGINPDLLVGMSHLETGIWTSDLWASKLNPGGIGGDTPEFQVTFDTGVKAARAMATHLMIYARGFDNDFKDWVLLDPIYTAPYVKGFASSAKTLAGLGNGKWAKAVTYKTLVATKMAEIKDSWQWATPTPVTP